MKILSLIALLLCLSGAVRAQSTISANRAIEIRIQGVPSEEMSRVNNTYPVSDGGFIRMPFIGNVRAAGLSPNALAASIEAAYRAAEIYTSPTVQVIASSDETLTEHVITVGGYVRRNGPVKYTPGMTIYQALQSGGGANEFGSMHRVKLYRNGEVRQFDLTKNEAKNFLVEPNDTIEVPQKNLFGR